MNAEDRDARWMKLAIELAGKGLGLTSPNPCVGAVIVHKDQIIGSGFHEKPASPMQKEMPLPTVLPKAMPGCFRIPPFTLHWNRAARREKLPLVRKPLWNTVSRE